MSFLQLHSYFRPNLESNSNYIFETMWFHISMCVYISVSVHMCVSKRPGGQYEVTIMIKKNSLHSLCSSLCCKHLWTCQSLLSSPAGFLLPGSSWLPSLCGQSAGRPGRPCPRQSGWRCAAFGKGPTLHWTAVAGHQPGSWRQGRGL